MLLAAIVLWIVAFIIILVTLVNIIRRAVKMKRCTAQVTGVISDVTEKVRRREGYISTEYIPTVAYTVDGTDYSRPFTKAYHADTYRRAQALQIMYNPQNPKEINKMGTSNKADIVMLCIGVLIGVAGAVLLALQ